MNNYFWGTTIILMVLIALIATLLLPGRQKSGIHLDRCNIVLITIDTLRPDHLSCYGYGQNTSPAIDKIAARGMVFSNAFATSSWTAPSIASLFTSVYPTNHGVKHGFVRNGNVYKQEVFSGELTTLAEILQRHGYTTFGIASNHHLGKAFGFARGFDFFRQLPNLPAREVENTLTAWKDELNKADKYFLWLHYFDPHYPYNPKSPWVNYYTSPSLTSRMSFNKKTVSALRDLIPLLQHDPQALANLVALYDSEINYTDLCIGEIIDEFSLDQNTIFIITSDHGEEFLDHNDLFHALTLYDESIAIPLIIKLPDGTHKEVVGDQVSIIDIMPSLLDILDIPPPKHAMGKSFFSRDTAWSRAVKGLTGKEDVTFAELDRNSHLKAIITPRWKYIYNVEYKTGALYDRKSDPQELHNLADSETDRQEQLEDQLRQWVSAMHKYPPGQESAHLSPQDREKLEGLGYLR